MDGQIPFAWIVRIPTTLYVWIVILILQPRQQAEIWSFYLLK